MASGTGTVKTHHVGMSSSTYQTTGGEYYTQTASSTEDGGNITFTHYSSEPVVEWEDISILTVQIRHSYSCQLIALTI